MPISYIDEIGMFTHKNDDDKQSHFRTTALPASSSSCLRMQPTAANADAYKI